MQAPLASPCGRAAHVVAGEAAGHARELVARRQLELADLPVALPALDVAREVLRVREAEVRRREHHRRDLPALAGGGADVAERALRRSAARVGPRGARGPGSEWSTSWQLSQVSVGLGSRRSAASTLV